MEFKKRQRSTGRTDQSRSYVEKSVRPPFYTTLIQNHQISQNYKMNPLLIWGSIANRPTEMLIDSGASVTLINTKLFYKLPMYIRQNARNPSLRSQIQLADKSCIQITKTILLPITIENQTRKHVVYVVPELGRSCIIGNDFIRRYNIQIDGGSQRVKFKEFIEETPIRSNYELRRENEERYMLFSSELVKIPSYHVIHIQVHTDRRFEEEISDYEVTSVNLVPCVANGLITPQKIMNVQVANLSKKTIIVHPGQALASMTRLNEAQLNALDEIENRQKENKLNNGKLDIEPDLSDTNLNQQQQQDLKKVLISFSDIFRKQNGRTNMMRHQIKLIPESKPINSPPYRYAPAKRQVIEQNLKEMKEEGIIVPSKSPWASPVVLAPKKDGTIRFCVDYRKLNSITIRDAYPIPRIDDTLDALQEAKFVSTLDLRSGYWQVEMEKESKEKTAFITHKGLYEFNVMPYGLTNAPATFQRLMDIVLAGLKWQCCLVYIDDVVIYSPTFDQHLNDLKEVFQTLREANLTLKASKCYFCRREMKYLGHVITQDGIKPDPSLTQAVSDFPQPQTIKDVQSFLGLSGYYRRFIKDYAKIAEPLINQLRKLKEKNNHLNWTVECTVAFEALKKRLTNAPIMSTPNFKESFILELDACEYGLGAVLAQEYDKKKFVIAYASRTLSPPERNYSATEREALAIVWATQHFRPYLEGTKVLIRSDCKALQWLKNAKDVSGRLARWAMKLSAFQIESIQYRPGTANANADSLSRNPLTTTSSLDNQTLEWKETKENVISKEKDMKRSSKPYDVSALDTIINVWENTNILDNVKNEQLADPSLNRIIQQLKANSSPEFNDRRQPFVLINDILYKIKNSNRHYNQRVLGNKHLLVIPKTMQNKILKWAHDHPTGGHAGQQKTLFRLSSRVYWASMRKDIYKHVAACVECQRFKYNNIPTATPMQLHEVLEPWHTIGIDLMGPFPSTARQKRFLLVIVDYFTRWIEVFPMRVTTSIEIAEVLINQVFTRYGLPRYILSDNGPQFVSNLFDEFCRLMAIKRKFTANYHPQTNMTERVNRTLKPLIAIFAQEHPHSWDKEIQKLALAIRTSVNETTGEIPAFLMFGRDPIIPLDLIIGDPIQDLPPVNAEQEQIQGYKYNLMNNLRVAFNTVREHPEVEKLSQKMKYDRHTTQREFEEGDLVWVATTAAQIGENSTRGKLQPSYQGPCRITEKLAPSTFIVKRISNNVNLGATNADRLKLYYEPVSDASDSQMDLMTQEDEPPIQDHPEATNLPATTSTPNNQVARRLPSNRQRRVPVRYLPYAR